MKITVDLGDLEGLPLFQGRFEQYRCKRITVEKAIKTSRGNARLTVQCFVYVRDRKKAWKPRKALGLGERNLRDYRALTGQVQ